MKYLMKTMTIIFIFILPLEIIGQGSVINVSFYSNTLSMNRNVQIYLPDGYNPQDSIRYPSIYFLHGAFGNHTSYPEIVGILDNLISTSSIEPCIVIKPDGSCGPWAGSVYTNSELYGDFEDYIVFDLVEYVDSTYKTIQSRDKRVIMGISMGGYGCMKLALKHPDIYCGVAAHSGPLDFNLWHTWVPSILNENGGAPPYTYVSTVNRIFTYFFYTLAGAFSPNVNNTPYPVDFPLDSNGVIIDTTFDRWLLHDPARLASNISPSSDLAIYFDCGMQDELYFYQFNTSFADSLNSNGIDYIFEAFIGTHSNQFLNRFPIAVSFLDSVLNSITNIEDEYETSVHSFLLYQNYPNPFNPNTTIKYKILKSENVRIEVFNSLGQKITTLLDRTMQPGLHQIEFNGKDFSSGVYMYKISTNGFQNVKKMVLLQ